jgi:hypothetical protein
VSGSAEAALREALNDAGVTYFINAKGLNLMLADEPEISTAPPVVLTPDTGIIGTPVQTAHGIYFRTLLNPRIEVTQPTSRVKIDNTAIRQAKVRVGEYITPLDQDGIYNVVGVRYVGDSRGQDWYCEVTAVSDSWYKSLDSGNLQQAATGPGV